MLANNTVWNNKYGVILRGNTRSAKVLNNVMQSFKVEKTSSFQEDYNYIKVRGDGLKAGRHSMSEGIAFDEGAGEGLALTTDSAGVDAGTSDSAPTNDQRGRRRVDVTSVRNGLGHPGLHRHRCVRIGERPDARADAAGAGADAADTAAADAADTAAADVADTAAADAADTAAAADADGAAAAVEPAGAAAAVERAGAAAVDLAGRDPEHSAPARRRGPGQAAPGPARRPLQGLLRADVQARGAADDLSSRKASCGARPDDGHASRRPARTVTAKFTPDQLRQIRRLSGARRTVRGNLVVSAGDRPVTKPLVLTVAGR